MSKLIAVRLVPVVALPLLGAGCISTDKVVYHEESRLNVEFGEKTAASMYHSAVLQTGADASPGDGVCQTSTAGECTLPAALMEASARKALARSKSALSAKTFRSWSSSSPWRA